MRQRSVSTRVVDGLKAVGGVCSICGTVSGGWSQHAHVGSDLRFMGFIGGIAGHRRQANTPKRRLTRSCVRREV
jgi:hypothetical protein